jgi:hypothetical protein
VSIALALTSLTCADARDPPRGITGHTLGGVTTPESSITNRVNGQPTDNQITTNLIRVDIYRSNQRTR